MIELERVSKIYHRNQPGEIRAVEDVTLMLPTGGVTVLKGPSGSGKSSLLAMIGGMSRPTSGRITMNGRDVSRLPEHFLTALRRQTFGYVFQQYHLLPGLSVMQNVLLPLYPLPGSLRSMEERARRVLAELQMEGTHHRKVRQLSGGEQQRVAIARALVNDPQVVIADEPTAHLDSALSRELLAIFAQVKGAGKTLVIATHDPLVFDHPLVDRIVSLRDGRLVAEAPA